MAIVTVGRPGAQSKRADITGDGKIRSVLLTLLGESWLHTWVERTAFAKSVTYQTPGGPITPARRGSLEEQLQSTSPAAEACGDLVSFFKILSP